MDEWTKQILSCTDKLKKEAFPMERNQTITQEGGKVTTFSPLFILFMSPFITIMKSDNGRNDSWIHIFSYLVLKPTWNNWDPKSFHPILKIKQL